MGIFLKEHISSILKITNDINVFNLEEEKYLLHISDKKLELYPRIFKKERGKDYPCFNFKITDNEVILNSDYFVGLDWLTKDRYIHVEPKLNFGVLKTFEKSIEVENEDFTDDEIENLDLQAEIEIQKVAKEPLKEVDIIAMLMKIMSNSEIAKQTEKLLLIDWEIAEIPITQKQDVLTPFLVVKFLNLLKDIARKGLKKSYYKEQENLRNKVKGKILVGQQIKQNVFKNRFTNTVCEYQVFGEDSIENRFLKKVFLFCTQYVENNNHYFRDKNDIFWMVNYIRPTLENINSEIDLREIKHLKHNPFFKEYKDAIKIGQQILKRFSYNITKVTAEKILTPPFWIDMPKMFELYVYAMFLEDNPSLSAAHFNYQFATHGNSLDFLVCASDKKIVVDTKYKLKYNYTQIHEDIRQVAGYARLNKVRDEVGYENKSEEVDCLIIYPKPIIEKEIESGALNIENILSTKIDVYHKVFKLGISLPTVE